MAASRKSTRSTSASPAASPRRSGSRKSSASSKNKSTSSSAVSTTTPMSTAVKKPKSNILQRLQTVGTICIVGLSIMQLYPPLLAILVVAIAIDEYHCIVRSDADAAKQSGDVNDEHLPPSHLCPPPTRRSRICHVIGAVCTSIAALFGHEAATCFSIVLCNGINIAAMLHDSTVADIHVLSESKKSRGPSLSHFHTLAVDVLGQLYVAYLWSHTVLLLKPVHAPAPFLTVTTIGHHEITTIILVIFITGMGENGGLLFGSTFGGKKLIPRVSPKKTLAGFIGQIIMSLLAATLYTLVPYKPANWSIFDGVALGLLIGILGSLGDLLESYIKRAHARKDSNVLLELPGTGGVLDRIDGLLFTFAATYYYYRFRGFI